VPLFVRIYFQLDQESKSQLIIISPTMPDVVRKSTKKYLSNDCVTINFAQEDTKDEESTDDEVLFMI
jgi:hypothetical protein